MSILYSIKLHIKDKNKLYFMVSFIGQNRFNFYITCRLFVFEKYFEFLWTKPMVILSGFGARLQYRCLQRTDVPIVRSGGTVATFEPVLDVFV